MSPEPLLSGSSSTPPERGGRRLGSARPSVLARAILSVAVVVGCEEVTVDTVAVARVDVTPETAELFVGETVRLTASARDAEGGPLSGRRTAWRSENPSVATVDSTGLVVGMGGGTTDITATVEGQTGSAAVVVRRLPAIQLDRGSIAFSATEGTGNPAPVEIGVTNGGDGSLSSLSRSVTYESMPGGWLEARLDSTGTPTFMTLTALTASMPVGTHSATVEVADPEASNSPVALDVTFRVEQSVTEPPSAPPSGLTAVAASDTRIDLTWTDNSATETFFQVERQPPGGTFTQIATPAADATAYPDTGLEPATQYAYRVRACNSAGCSAYSNTASATTGSTPAPAAPTSLTANLVGGSSAELAWTDNSSDEDEFRVERSVDGAAFADHATLPANTTQYADDGLAQDRQYSYRVEACGAGGCSAYTNEAGVVTPPMAPGGLTATAASPTSVDLDWADNSATEDEFRIERSTGSGFTQLATVPTDSSAFTDSTAEPGTAYTYRVLACNAGGCSAASGEAAATTPLAAPSSLSAAAVSPTAIDLAWTDNSGNESEFRIERDGGAGFTQIATVPADSSAYPDTGLDAGITYTYRVRACNAVTCSEYSGEASATTGSPPAAPTDLTATTVSVGQVDLAWTDNSADETDFRIERAVGTGSFAVLTSVGANVTTYSDNTTAEDTEYTYRVAACNSGACSAPSNEATAITPPSAASDLSVSPVSASALDLAWTDNSDTETEFRVQRRTVGGTFAQIAVTAADTTTYSDTGLQTATTYEYQVLACNASGCAAPSNIAAGTTGDVAPAAPSGLSATTDTAGGTVAIDLAWTDNSDNESRFEVQRSVSGGSFTLLTTTGTDVNDYSDGSVSPDTEYSYRVRACNAAGCSSFTAIAIALTPPTAPSGITATAVSNTRIDVTWTDNSATEASFRVEQRTGTADFSQVAVTGADVTAYSSTNLEPSTEYDFRVRACNSGGCSVYSDTATAATLATSPPDDPTSLTATLAGDGSSVDLTWVDNSGDETEFRIQRSIDGGTFTQRATVGANTTTFTDTDITVDNLYTYRVEACGDAGCSNFSNEASVVTLPVAPTGLAATVVSAGQVDLAWTDASDTEDEFRIERSVSGGPFTDLTTVLGGVTTFSDNTTVEDTEYAYRIEACNATGCSPFSNEETAVTPPPAPTGLVITSVTTSQIQLGWTDASDTETRFEVERSVDGGGFTALADAPAEATTYTDGTVTEDTNYAYRVRSCNADGCSAFAGPVATTTPPSAASGLTANAVSDTEITLSWADNSDTETEFRVERRPSGGTFAQVGTTGTNVTTFDDTGLDPATTYEYQVLACNASGCATPSAIASATTQAIPAPSGLSATVQSANQVDLVWTDNSGTETRFEIERSTDGGASFTALDNVGADIETYSDNTTVEDTEYVYRVAACNAGGCSDFSNQDAVTTPPSAPTNLNANAASDTRIDLSWADNSDTETGFEVWAGPSGGSLTLITTTAAGATSYNDTGLDPQTTYDYRVRACNGGGCSPYTAIATATTDPIPAPSGLSATVQSANRIDLTWTHDSNGEDEFQIQRSTDGGAFAALATVGANVTTYSDLTTTADTEYTYRVRACAGTCSAWSNQTTAITPPTAPTGLVITSVTTSQIQLGWTDASDTETRFEVERSVDGGGFTALPDSGANATAYVDATVAEDTEYAYRVAACNANGCSGFAGPVATPTPPTAPSGLGALALSDTEIQLSWTNNSDTEAEFEIQRRLVGGTFTDIDPAPAGATSYTDTGLTANTTYEYQIRACNSGGCSAYTATASATTFDALPLAPSDLTATTISANQVDLSWADNSGNEDEFVIERSVSGGTFAALATVPAEETTYSDVTTQSDTEYAYQVAACNAVGCSAFSAPDTTFTSPAAPTNLTATYVSDTQIDLGWTDNSTTASQFRIDRSVDGGGFAVLATVDTPATTYSDNNTTSDTEYAYRVAACNPDGCSAFSNEDTVATTPSGISNLTLTVVSDTEIDLSWVDNSSVETEQLVYRRIGGGFNLIATLGADVESYEDTGLLPLTSYTYRIDVCDDAGCSGVSSMESAETDSIPAPTGLTASVISATRVDLSWSHDSNGEDEFQIERSTDGGANFSPLGTVGADITTYSDQTTTGDTEYVYRVRACGSGSCSSYSNEETATTTPTAPTGLSATVQSANQVDLAWADNSDTETRFNIERSTDGTTFDSIASTLADVNAYSDLTTVEDVAYTYRVAACNADGCSAYSNEDAVTTPPTAPSGLGALALSDTEIQLSWTDTSDTEATFEIEQRPSGGTFTQIAAVGPNTESYTDIELTASTTYDYQIRACNTGGCSANTAIASATTDAAP